MRVLELLRNEFSNKENMKSAERGVLFGLIVGTIFAAVFTTSDWMALNFDYIRGQNPYGVLWYLLNPNFWTDIPYRIWVTFFLFVCEAFMYFGFVRHGRLSKFLFYAGWLQSIIWMRGTVYQNVTVTALAPLASIMPFVIIPFMLLQKLPLGWSWNLSDKHWWCAFTGNSVFTNGDTIWFPNGQKLISCPSSVLRLNPEYSWFWSYLMIMTWIILPLLFYLKTRNRGKWQNIRDVDILNYSRIAMIANLKFNAEWFCTLCGKWMNTQFLLLENEDRQNGLWFDGEWLCWECCLTPSDEVQAKLFKSGLWE